jgi:hypothetical protein
MKDKCNCPMPTENTDEWIPHEPECPESEGDDDTQVCISHDKNLTLEQVLEKHLAGECAACAEYPYPILD